ncbi:ral guanine nucleotide dissociation stimulator-like 1 isoform X2 [Esox lucius]|uniref:ral guanine nucleotide dissociation stimulator-like 1 isoform X2 n=1 Tax=Esox lucius TaxID=8010 RepID=UPI0014770636|nr:ral guanine nucleotide dissociation stimulator-like 1 isoform X2 [Esox lucius]
MGKWEISMNPVQEWGEEFEEGALYGITLHREPIQIPTDSTEAQPCFSFVQYRTCKVRRLKAATLNRLVNHLLDPCVQEPGYRQIFLSTYRSFTTTSALIELLFQRNDVPSDVDNSECYRRPLSPLIQTWLEEYSEDFRDPPHYTSLRLLLDHLHRHSFCLLAQRSETLLKKFQRESTEKVRTFLFTSPEMDTCGPCAQAEKNQGEECSGKEDPEWDQPPDQDDIMDFSVTGIAEQLTRLDAELFEKVVPFQCLGCVWSQRDKKENLCPTVSATIAQFNSVTNRVITSLLCWPTSTNSSPTSVRRASSPAQRARVIEKWIRVAQECRQLKNFSSLRAVLSALQSNAIYRLRKTWAAVCRDSMAIFDNLSKTFPDENREILAEDGSQPAPDNISPKISKQCPISRQMSISNGTVPYLGTYLTVLTMLDTALPDTVEGDLINFEKRRREFEILSQIQQLQMSCSQYNLPHHIRIHAWLQGQKLLTDQESYELSRNLEPPVDLSSPSPWSHRKLSRKLTSLLTGAEGSSRNTHIDQISVSSSGSSGSEMEELSSPPTTLGMQSLSSSCQNVSDTLSCPPDGSIACPPDGSIACPPDGSISSSSQTDTVALAPEAACPKPTSVSHHKRSVSMTSFPLYNRQVADSCIVRVSVEAGNGNMYKSILLTSQDKTAQVIQRALEKHNLEHMSCQDFTLRQVISQERELIIPDKANVFYAMSTSANYDFVLHQRPKSQKKPLCATASLGRYSK